MDYNSMRAFADSWGLLGMAVFFVGVVLWIFLRPGSRKKADQASRIPLEDD